MSRKTDQFPAPSPAVVFVTEHAAQRIVAELTAKYQEAARHATSMGGTAIQKGEEIAQLEKEIAEKQAWVIQKDGEKRQAEAEARAAQDVAKGYADMLAAAGVHIPPFGGELSHAPDGALERFDAAHADLERAGGHS
ncbi:MULTISPECIES: hypothetical protein [Nonomuraea]|uniref:Uncharacterized protein n=1 Tax=Nonomuraea wenchangensis TaxID=568860 RepID=A0A1I0F338_9ACTN|nr:hypothetical protein [Nonomuraea wenchangensis]SET51802.1 hypothetical protein SAMN05421811_103287 [Nonomuraea wenchangensis]